jgi:hypothetical protein
MGQQKEQTAKYMDQRGFKNVSRRLVIELAAAVALVSYKVNFPKHTSGSQAWKFVLHHPPVLLHVIVGTIIVVEAVILLIRSLRSKNHTWIMLALAGLIFVLSAWQWGERYVWTQSNSALTYMGNFWFVAIAIYGFGWYWGRKKSAPHTSADNSDKKTE